MRIGLITDMHLGYVRGTREENGVNVREQDVINAARDAVQNLVAAKVDAIVDLGDMAHVPAPKKRAILALINIINDSGLDWYSANGNHTLQRTRSDSHLYDVLSALCPRFHGFTEATIVSEVGGLLIPYGTEHDMIEEAKRDGLPDEVCFVGGHFACDDVPFPGDHVSVDDLPPQNTFLGHYHSRKLTVVRDVPDDDFDPAGKAFTPSPTSFEGPVYIGATERFAWGEWDNPTGVAVYNTNDGSLEFIEHETRGWLDLHGDSDNYLDTLRSADMEGKIVRLTVEANAAQYSTLDIREVRALTRGALEFQVRRSGTTTTFTADHAETATYSLLDAWKGHVERMKADQRFRKRLLDIGSQALAAAGGVAE